MLLGLDYSAGRPAAAQVLGAGYRFVARYLSWIGNPKNITASEFADMRAHGVDVVLVFESTSNRALGGHAAGVADAQAAMAQASGIGAASAPLYFAVDFDVPDYAPASHDAVAKLGGIAAYFQGVVSVVGLRRTGVYGGYWAVKRVLDAGLAHYAWQAAAWSGGQVDNRIHLYQRVMSTVVGGIACDVNEAHAADYGQVGAPRRGEDGMTTFLKNLVTGESATQDGPFVSGLDPATAAASLAAWPGSCEIGVSQQEWDDRIAKSNALQSLSTKLDAVVAAITALSTTGPVTGGMSQQQLTTVVTAGVAAALGSATFTAKVAS